VLPSLHVQASDAFPKKGAGKRKAEPTAAAGAEESKDQMDVDDQDTAEAGADPESTEAHPTKRGLRACRYLHHMACH